MKGHDNRTPRVPHQPRRTSVYFTDRGIEELEKRRGEEEVTFEWLAEQLRTFVDLNPDFEVPVERLATWLARLDDEDEDE
ncbi:hypothetical protein ADL01_01820 [Streptomyces sp. NRRL WC-3618]|nr:hypothetical protein ADL01_01820 [Streptomyces sp. NRRL WC-3618]